MAKVFDEHEMTVALRKGYAPDKHLAFFRDSTASHHWFTTGITEADLVTLKEVCEHSTVDRICIDVANGYTERFINTVKKIREMYPDKTIMAGNVVTGDMTEALILAGADVVKIGIGPGSVCTTRKMTGVGYPQLSAILECADAAHGLGGLICADGGCQVPGDVAKAFGAGADFVMLGGMLAGHEEGEYEYETGPNDEKICVFYGMSSDEAQLQNGGEVKNYRASEGKAVGILYRGSVDAVIRDVKGGVRSMMTYIGAKNMKEISKRTTFVRVSQQLNPMFPNT
jgi:GMP reductase